MSRFDLLREIYHTATTFSRRERAFNATLRLIARRIKPNY